MTTPENLDDLVTGEPLELSERDVEAPVEDAHEQSIPTDADPPDEPVHRGLEVSEYDAIDQSRPAPPDDDAYR